MINYRIDILEIRKQRGVSVVKLSKSTGIPEDRIYKWESGVGNPKAEDSEKLQEWLDGEAKRLLKVEEPASPYIKVPAELNEAWEVILRLTGQQSRLIDQQDRLINHNGKLVDSNASLVRQSEVLVSKISSGGSAVASPLSSETAQPERVVSRRQIPSDRPKKRSSVKQDQRKGTS